LIYEERTTICRVSHPSRVKFALNPASKRLVLSALAQFIAKTAGRNMTKTAYAAVAPGVAAMVLLTVAPAYEAAQHWVDAVLWACLVYFVFEWLVRLRHMAGQGRLSLYTFSGSGIVDAIGALAVPVALLSGIEPRTAWLLGIQWVLKVVQDIPGLRLRRVPAVATWCRSRRSAAWSERWS
jgi:voltage-gated potassium channel